MRLKRKVGSILLALSLLLVAAGPGFAQTPTNDADDDAAKEALPEYDASAIADPDKRYDILTAQAAAAYRAEDYAEAVKRFEQAYALRRVPNLLYNMGRAEEKRGDFEAAIGYYERFVTEPGVKIEARQNALARLKTLREVVALNAANTEQAAGAEPTEPKNEAASATPETDARSTPPSPPRMEADYTAAWVTLGVAAAAYVTSGVFAWQARDAHSDFEKATSRGELRDAASRGQTASIVADSTLGLGVIMTGLGVYFLLSPFEHEVAPEKSAMRLTPQIGKDRAGLRWSVSF